METLPAGGKTGLKVAFSRTAGSVLSTPMQFGPTRRIPAARARSRRRRSTARPSAPVSAKPAVITTTPRTPDRAHSSIASSTAAAGTATTARSIETGRMWTSATPAMLPLAG